VLAVAALAVALAAALAEPASAVADQPKPAAGHRMRIASLAEARRRTPIG